MNKSLKGISSLVLFLVASQAASINLKQGHLLLEAGAFSSTQGKNQDINIEGLIGDRFNVTKRHDSNALFGLGYLIEGMKQNKFGIDYGINAFYLAQTQVHGTIDQELLYTNLGYSYKVSHLPVYATAKATIKTHSEKLAVTLDAGVGPNFIKTSQYHDWILNNTLHDYSFLGRSNVTFSAMAGIGLKLSPLLGQLPLECGYRFFYLGHGGFNSRTDQILNTLKTGNNYAQALVCTVTV
jgi:hypothetical protein